jgi:3-methyladenine DNA glycosylase AlkD
MYAQALKNLLAAHAKPEDAFFMAKYMKNHFSFLGIKTPLRVQLWKQFLAEHENNLFSDTEIVYQTVWELWAMPERELQYCAIDLLEKTKKNWTEDIIFFFEQLLITKSWWDSVDSISGNLIGVYFLRFPNQIRPITEGWMASNNRWLQRVCLIFQLKYKEKTDVKLLFNYIHQLSFSKEFFIQKAIGWALRQYARTDADAIIAFVEVASLAPLSKREALKHL